MNPTTKFEVAQGFVSPSAVETADGWVGRVVNVRGAWTGRIGTSTVLAEVGTFPTYEAAIAAAEAAMV